MDFKEYLEDKPDAMANNSRFEKKDEDVTVVLKLNHKGTLLLFPVNFFGSHENGVEMLLVEYLSVAYIIEDIPPFGTKNQAEEFLRRLAELLVVQDRAEQGYATPYHRHLHPSMARFNELYIMATQCPWGFQDDALGNNGFFLKENNFILFSCSSMDRLSVRLAMD